MSALKCSRCIRELKDGEKAYCTFAGEISRDNFAWSWAVGSKHLLLCPTCMMRVMEFCLHYDPEYRKEGGE